VSERLCKICRRADCRTEAHNGPDQFSVPGIEREPKFASGLGVDCAVISNCRSRIARLPVSDATVEQRARALAALDECFDAYRDEFVARPRPRITL